MMNVNGSTDKHGNERGGHRGHRFWATVACCLPMIVIFALIALGVRPL